MLFNEGQRGYKKRLIVLLLQLSLISWPMPRSFLWLSIAFIKSKSFYRSFDREGLGKISEKTFKELLKAKDDIPDEDIEEMLEEYYRLAKLKGIATVKPDPPSDSDDEEGEDGGPRARPPPPPPPPTVKSPPSTKRGGKMASIKSPTKSQTVSVVEEEKWIDYRGMYFPPGRCF